MGIVIIMIIPRRHLGCKDIIIACRGDDNGTQEDDRGGGGGGAR